MTRLFSGLAVFGLLLVAIALSGCIQIGMVHALSPNGDLRTTWSIDLTAYAALAETQGTTTEQMKDEFAKGCDQMQETLTPKLGDVKDFTCTTKDFAIIFGYTENIAQKPYFKTTSSLFQTTYRYEFGNHPSFANSAGVPSLPLGESTPQDLQEIQDALGSSQSNATKELMRKAGAAITYNLTMPGGVSYASIGKIENGMLTIDLLSTNPDQIKGAYAESQVTDTGLLVGIAVVVLVLLGGVAYFVLKRKTAAPRYKR